MVSSSLVAAVRHAAKSLCLISVSIIIDSSDEALLYFKFNSSSLSISNVLMPSDGSWSQAHVVSLHASFKWL